MQYTCWRPTPSTPTAGTGVTYIGAVYSASGAAGSWSTPGSRCSYRLQATTAATSPVPPVVGGPPSTWTDSTRNRTNAIQASTVLAIGSNAAAWGFTAPAVGGATSFGVSLLSFAMGTSSGTRPVNMNVSLVLGADSSSNGAGTVAPVGRLVASTVVSLTLTVRRQGLARFDAGPFAHRLSPSCRRPLRTCKSLSTPRSGRLRTRPSTLTSSSFSLSLAHPQLGPACTPRDLRRPTQASLRGAPAPCSVGSNPPRRLLHSADTWGLTGIGAFGLSTSADPAGWAPRLLDSSPSYMPAIQVWVEPWRLRCRCVLLPSLGGRWLLVGWFAGGGGPGVVRECVTTALAIYDTKCHVLRYSMGRVRSPVDL